MRIELHGGPLDGCDTLVVDENVLATSLYLCIPLRRELRACVTDEEPESSESLPKSVKYRRRMPLEEKETEVICHFMWEP